MLAVTTGLPCRSAARISSRAGSMPPMTSTTTSIAGSSTSACGVAGEHAVGQVDVAVAGEVAHGHPGDLEAQAGAGLDDVGLPARADQGGADVAAAEHADPHDLAGIAHGGEGTGAVTALTTPLPRAARCRTTCRLSIHPVLVAKLPLEVQFRDQNGSDGRGPLGQAPGWAAR